MDGYSVNEAAAVLGIPEARVWELLARGVLAGSTEVGGDMRVLLRNAAVAETPKSAPPANGHGNGSSNGGSHGSEINAFRELLTEFRNLTERYGQALLALGESRGEVASLRGRVELLETRMELRMAAPAPMTAWSTAAPPAAEDLPEEAPEAAFDDADGETQAFSEGPTAETAPSGPPPATPFSARSRRAPRPAVRPSGSRQSRPNGRPRTRTAGFAEALARAEDPSSSPVGDVSEPLESVPLPASALPGAEETAAAIAAFRDESERDQSERAEVVPEPAAVMAETLDVPPVTAAEEAPPETGVLPSVEDAEQVEVNEPTESAVTAESPEWSVDARPVFVRPGYGTDTPEPDWIAEEDLLVAVGPASTPAGAGAWHDAAPSPAAAQSAVAVAEPVLEAEAEPVAEAEPFAEAEPRSAPARANKSVTSGDLAAEPLADDDGPLVESLVPFSEPPIIPSGPAFWEPAGRAQAPFAIPHLETWEPDEIDQLRAELSAPVVLEAGSTLVPVTAPPVAPPALAAPEPPPAHVEPEPPPTLAAAEPLSASPRAPETLPSAARPQRGPAARAVRRLRRILG